MKRRTLIVCALAPAAGLALRPGSAQAHHGWSSFDQDRPLYLEGRAPRGAWRTPHTDLASRAMPAQAVGVDGPALLRSARLPIRRDRRWLIELAPLTRMNAWKVAEIRTGDTVAVLGFTFAGEKGDALLRAEYLWAGGGVYGLRSAPA